MMMMVTENNTFLCVDQHWLYGYIITLTKNLPTPFSEAVKKKRIKKNILILGL